MKWQEGYIDLVSRECQSNLKCFWFGKGIPHNRFQRHGDNNNEFDAFPIGVLYGKESEKDSKLSFQSLSQSLVKENGKDMFRRFECNRKPVAQPLEGRVQSGTETGAGLSVHAGLGAGAGAAVELEYEVSDREEVTFNASDRKSILARLLAWMNSESTETNRDHISRLLNAPGMLETCLEACKGYCNRERNHFLLSVLDEM